MLERIDEAPCGLVEFSAASAVIFINRTLLGWLQKAAEQCVGQRFDALLTVANQVFFHTHFFPMLQLSGKADEIFLSLKRADGSSFPVITSAVRTCTGTYQCVFLPVPQRRQYEDEILQAKKAAEDALKSNAELNAAKSAVEKYASDLERRIREIEQRNAELKTVSQILSHDVREPVRKIQLFADMIRENVDLLNNFESREAIEKIESEAGQINALIRAMRQYLQVDTTSSQKLLDISKIVNDAISAVALKQSFSEWEIEMDKLPTLPGRCGPLLLLFSEILENAIKFRHPSRKLRLKITTQVIQRNLFEDSSQRYQFIDFARITIQDNGRGFSAKYNDYVFGLLKKVALNSPGLGLGLALCRKIAASHFGLISAVPDPEIGTTIVIELPLTLV